MTNEHADDEETIGPEVANGEPLAAKPADAAVRRALVESRRGLLGVLTRRLGNREEAEEVLQQFTLRALERASDLRDVRTVRGWLGRVLATAIIDHQRRAMTKRRREVAMELEDMEREPAFAFEPDSEIDQAVCACLYQLLPTLRPEYSEVIRHADLLGEPRDRIAINLGTNVNNITVRLHRGRQALRKRLEQMCVSCSVHGFLNCSCNSAEQLRSPRSLDPGL